MKNNHFTTRITALLLVLMLLVGMLAGCSSVPAASEAAPAAAAQESSAPAESTGTDDAAAPAEEAAASAETDGLEYNDDTSPFEFTAWWPNVWSFCKGAVEGGWDPSVDVFQHITEKTGGTMNIDMPSGDQNELAGVLIASGAYPDVMVFEGYNNTYIQQMIDAGLVYSWNELIDTYCPKMWDLLPSDLIAQHGDENGTLWYLPGFAYDDTWAEKASAFGAESGSGCYQENIIFCRKDILDAFGKEDITDLDTFTEYLRFVKANYPDVEPLELFADDPRTEDGLFRHFMSTFGCDLTGTYNADDGTVKHFMYDPAYVDYLKYLNGLYSEGIITDNQLTYDQSAIDTKEYSASFGAFEGAPFEALTTLNGTLRENFGEDTEKQYIDVGPIQKADVDWQSYYVRSKGGFSTLITKNCADPERVVKFFEYLMTDDGQKTMACGLENVAWWYGDDGKVVHEEERLNLAMNDLEGYITKYRVCGYFTPWISTAYWEGLLGPMITPPAGDAMAVVMKRLPAENVTDPWQEGYAAMGDAIPAGSDLDVIKTKVDDVCKTAAMRMIAAKSDAEFDSLYQDCLKEIESLGVSQMNDAYTAEHQRQAAALGIEP